METRAKKTDGGEEIQEGEVVLIAVSDLNKGKLNSGNIVGAVVEKTATDNYRIVCKEGQLQRLYPYHQLTWLILALPTTATFMGWRRCTPVGEGYRRCQRVQ
jgi:hypothetical protein